MAQFSELACCERRIVREEFKACDSHRCSRHIVLVYPSDDWNRNPRKVLERVEAGYCFLCNSTPAKQEPAQAFGRRIVVGFRHPSKDCDPHLHAGWVEAQNRVNVPWCRLCERETDPITVDISHQPEFVCSHELVHPFEHLFLACNQNKAWNEGVCDFLRAFVLKAMGLPYAEEWRDHIAQCAGPPCCHEYHPQAGKIWRWFEKRLTRGLDMEPQQLCDGLSELVSQDMCDVLRDL